eukprot:CAMPEP_0114994468 /NCGR_PEP_ID=MMETSP0216-20121206/13154_1 /TAXON_ID=223996 /ORGANISM="Protocruzia adherens, Strain Boccale" /LENGTH=74 /DNA_ID=CAMNT_0002358329 /DNA_START=572 /DNA_END=796 /DNA_ORIENTATION=-
MTHFDSGMSGNIFGKRKDSTQLFDQPLNHFCSIYGLYRNIQSKSHTELGRFVFFKRMDKNTAFEAFESNNQEST